MSEGDFAVGNEFSNLSGESIVADDDLQFIISGHVLYLFLNSFISTGSPKSISAAKTLCSSFHWAKTGSVRLS